MENVSQNHDKQKEPDGQRMHRHDEGDDHDDPCLHNGFQRVKGEGSPGCRIGTEVVYLMKPPENRRVVHGPMSPVKVRVVNNQHERDAKPEIDPAVIGRILVKLPIVTQPGAKE